MAFPSLACPPKICVPQYSAGYSGYKYPNYRYPSVLPTMDWSPYTNAYSKVLAPGYNNPYLNQYAPHNPFQTQSNQNNNGGGTQTGATLTGNEKVLTARAPSSEDPGGKKFLENLRTLGGGKI
jgi:hypothetical protein